MRITSFILFGICVMIGGCLNDPVGSAQITIQVPGSSLTRSNYTIQDVVIVLDTALLKNGFGRNQQTHDGNDTNWVTIYSFTKPTEALSASCRVYEQFGQVKVIFSEYGLSRSSTQFVRIRDELTDTLVSKYGKDKVN